MDSILPKAVINLKKNLPHKTEIDLSKSVIDASNVRECSPSSHDDDDDELEEDDEEEAVETPRLEEVKSVAETPDPCLDQPCKNGGRCRSLGGGQFKCHCLSGYT